SGPAPQSPTAFVRGSSQSRNASGSQVWVSPLSGPLGQRIVSGPLGTPITSGPLGGAVASSPLHMPITTGQIGSGVPDGVALAQPGASSYQSAAAHSSRARVTTGGGTASPRVRDPRPLLPHLIRALMNLDTEAANAVIREAMDVCVVETLSGSLLQPAVSRITELWARHDITGPEEHFAMNYVRALLYAIFRNTPENPAGPLTFIACAPRELDDMSALMLAVFWRRAGLRVVYLGQDIEGDSLVEEARRRRPALICLSASASPRVRALARICRHIAQMDKPRPHFTFAGPIFTRNPELQRKVAGVYLGDDAATATWHVSQLVGLEH
ncbi:MAG: cobalamin B12-binding domain-containing protein, partial [Ktedonobacterales bacterium]